MFNVKFVHRKHLHHWHLKIGLHLSEKIVNIKHLNVCTRSYHMCVISDEKGHRKRSPKYLQNLWSVLLGPLPSTSLHFDQKASPKYLGRPQPPFFLIQDINRSPTKF